MKAALAPFAIGFNKVFFAQPEYVEIYRGALESKYDKAAEATSEECHRHSSLPMVGER